MGLWMIVGLEDKQNLVEIGKIRYYFATQSVLESYLILQENSIFSKQFICLWVGEKKGENWVDFLSTLFFLNFVYILDQTLLEK